jgi:adenylyl-sulfate kinase
MKELPIIWLTGLSGAGKSTIGDALLEELGRLGIQAARLDGDDLRSGLNSDLGFSKQDRSENLRRAAHVAGLFSRLGNVTICSFITPLSLDRAQVREILGDRYVEVYVRASLDTCEARDPKGLYRRARAGQIRDFTGITSDFDVPDSPDYVLDTEKLTVPEAVSQLVELIRRRI